jgi:hypothetical protein
MNLSEMESAVSDTIKERAKEEGQKAAILEMASAIMDEARAAEREQCAKLAEQLYSDDGWHPYYKQASQAIASAIRAASVNP